ncbi:MAG: HAD hydrolase family protein [Candidatus Bathyarchaeia archaeon]
MKRVFISDCEGPISKNDNAFEVASQFIPNGNRLFSVISRYDDVLAEVLKRPSYKAGYTLKLILPFLKAYDLTDQKMQEFSANSLVLISNVKDMLQHVRSIAHAFVVSTSYEHYIRALCQALDFPFRNTYCTKVSIDKHYITKQERNRLKELAAEIAQMQMITIPPNVKSMEEFSHDDQRTIHRLDEIFWEKIANMESGRAYSEVNPMGGGEKAEAIEDVVRKLKVSLADAMYVGDSITDKEAFRLVRENRGLAVSFNGNQYAVSSAEIAVLSETSISTAIIADIFCRFGKKQALELAENWQKGKLNKSQVNRSLLERFFKFNNNKSRVKIVTSRNVEKLARESNEFRRKVRGEAIGRLG